MEKTVQQVKVEKNLSFTEARTIVETSRPAATGKTYAAMVKVSTTSVAIQTDLTWSNGEEKYKKMSDIKKTNKQIAKAASNKFQKLHKCLWIPEIHQKVYLGSQAQVNLRQAKTQNSYQNMLIRDD